MHEQQTVGLLAFLRIILMRYLFILFTFITLGLTAQERKVQNKPFIDERRFHYGFFFGIHDQGIEFENNGYIDPVTGEEKDILILLYTDGGVLTK